MLPLLLEEDAADRSDGTPKPEVSESATFRTGECLMDWHFSRDAPTVDTHRSVVLNLIVSVILPWCLSQAAFFYRKLVNFAP